MKNNEGTMAVQIAGTQEVEKKEISKETAAKKFKMLILESLMLINGSLIVMMALVQPVTFKAGSLISKEFGLLFRDQNLTQSIQKLVDVVNADSGASGFSTVERLMMRSFSSSLDITLSVLLVLVVVGLVFVVIHFMLDRKMDAGSYRLALVNVFAISLCAVVIMLRMGMDMASGISELLTYMNSPEIASKFAAELYPMTIELNSNIWQIPMLVFYCILVTGTMSFLIWKDMKKTVKEGM